MTHLVRIYAYAGALVTWATIDGEDAISVGNAIGSNLRALAGQLGASLQDDLMSTGALPSEL